MTSQSNSSLSETVILKPSYRLPLLIISLGLIILPVPFPFHPWPTILITVFGLFLSIQSSILRIKFTSTDLIVLQFDNELRRFPFKEWIAWRLLLPEIPGLLYFREKASPHLLPILFDPKALKEQLKLRVGQLEKPPSNS